MNERKILVSPYEGKEPFIFISYSHKNKDAALSIVEHLQKDGYRVWYDEGIHPGSEWDEYIARFVANCTLFIALLSEEYLLSSNCKDELNYARNKEKNRVLIYLEEIELPAGMDLRLSRLQNIHKNNYSDEDSFYNKLYTSSGIAECKGFATSENACGKYSIYNVTSQDEFELDDGIYLIGRNRNKCKIFVDDNKVSFVHAILSVNKKIITIRDLNSTNGIYINDKLIEANTEYKIQGQDVIQAGDTKLVFKYKSDETSVLDESLPIETHNIHEDAISSNAGVSRNLTGAYGEACDNQLQDNSSRIDALHYTTSIISQSAQNKINPVLDGRDTDSSYLIDGRYRILKYIEQGILWKVYLVEHVVTGKKSSARVYTKKDDDSQEKFEWIMKQLLNEMSLLNKLDFVALPTISEVFNRNDSIIVIMDYIEGVTLGRTVRDSGLPNEHMLIDWAIQICRCLKYLHSQQPPIIHNDINPNSIMLKSDGRIKLIDFGAAMEIHDIADQDERRFGTSFYYAPEVFEGKIDQRTDIYAFGVTMYTLATGKNPNKPPYEMNVITEINPTISKQVSAIIGRCMERNPESRYQTIEKVLTDLLNCEEIMKNDRTETRVPLIKRIKQKLFNRD